MSLSKKDGRKMNVFEGSLTILIILLCITSAMAQSYVYNAYENSFVDERDGSTYNIIETDSSKWFAEDLHYIPKLTFWKNVIEGELFCESYKGTESIIVDENDSLSMNLLKESIENCRKVYYKWDLAMNSCPQGWHLARTEEWRELSAFLKKSPFLQNVIFYDYPKNYVNYYYGKEKIKFAIYDHLSMWWRADLDSRYKKNTRANVTHFQNKKIEIKKNTHMGSVLWTHNPTKSWKLLPARCVENKKEIDYTVTIPEVDTSYTCIWGCHKNKSDSAKVIKSLEDLL